MKRLIVVYFKSYYKILFIALIIYLLGYFSNMFLLPRSGLFNDFIPWGNYNLSIGDMCFFASLSLVLSTLWGGLYEKI